MIRSKRRRLAQLERLASSRLIMRDRHGDVINMTLEDLYLATKFSSDGKMDLGYPADSLTFTIT